MMFIERKFVLRLYDISNIFLFSNIWCWMKLPSIERLRAFNNTSEYELIDSRFNFPLLMGHEEGKENCSQYSSCYLVST